MFLIRFVSLMLILIGILLCAFAGNHMVLTVIGAMMIVGGIAIYLVLYRCPHCH